MLFFFRIQKQVLKNQQGFTYPEMIIVLLIIAAVFYFVTPLYKQYNSYMDLNRTASHVRDILRASLNKAHQGVLPSSGLRSYWVVRFDTTNTDYQIETAACRSTIFISCDSQSDYQIEKLPDHFHISHQFSGQSEVNIYFAPITGLVTVFDMNGNVLGNSIDVKIASDDYPDQQIVFHLSSNGNIIEERL